MRPPAALLSAALTVLPAACERPPAPPAEAAAAAPPAAGAAVGDDWRTTATAADASTLGRLAQAWRLARAEAEDAGFAHQVEALGPLVDPNAARAGDIAPPPGDYRCRSILLGSASPGDPVHAVSSWRVCSVEPGPKGDLRLTRAGGSRQVGGRLYPDTDRRMVFLGAQASGAGTSGSPAYGDRREDDRIGVFERIGPGRWRLVLPWPKQDGKLEILELVPGRP